MLPQIESNANNTEGAGNMTTSTRDVLPLVERLAQDLLTYLKQATNGDRPVVRLASPDELYKEFEALGVGLSFQENEEAHTDDQIAAAVQATMERSICTLHPMFANQCYAAADPIAIVGDWLCSLLNTNIATFEVAPVFTVMEMEIIKKIATLAGQPEAEGTFCAGGSLSNLLALHLARHKAFPDINTTGLGDRQLVAYTSAHSHYSFKKAVAILGLGFDNLVTVPCDHKGQMLPDALEEAIRTTKSQGKTPFFINGTAGTTVLGTFDPLDQIADIAQQHRIWFHIDGCYGASVLFSPEHKQIMAGVEKADSLAWNFHKMGGMTQQCSALLVAHKGLLRSCFATGAKYLFQPDKEYTEYDTGDKHFQCGRRPDVLKLWLAWKYRGDQAFRDRINKAVNHAVAFENTILHDPESQFARVYPRTFTNVCFWWLPPSLRGKDIARLTPDQRELLHQVAPAIKRKMQQEGTAMLSFQSIDQHPNFFRMLFMNPAVDEPQRQAILDLITQYGMELFGDA
jgi:glutamate/tyrosine decarboxylase-like PLP-dependent enzyme